MMSDLDVRDLRGRIRRIVIATLVAVFVTRAAIRAVDALTGQRVSSLVHGSIGLATVTIFAGSVFVIAWAITVAAATTVTRRRTRRTRAPLPAAWVVSRRAG